jgi:CDP-diacylglycerol--glycerol-3-phosphate 3-phosphatidyltransferase
VLFIVAAISDGLDGYLARRRNQVSPLGIALDPIADKIFAGVIVILLILYRDLPIWLAAVIVGRDLVILGAAAILLRGRTVSLPSNLIGKYAFTAIAFLLGSYVIRFQFGIWLFTILTLVMIALSLVAYAGVFIEVRAGRTPRPLREPGWVRVLRLVASAVVLGYFFLRLYLDVLR